MALTVVTKTKTAPRHPYEAIAKSVVGESYDLTLVFIGEKRARALNRNHRGGTYVANVLSFPLSAHAGEIYIAPKTADREAKKFHMTPNNYVAYLFIHGLLHLKGYHHGDTMEKVEKKYIAQYRLK